MAWVVKRGKCRKKNNPEDPWPHALRSLSRRQKICASERQSVLIVALIGPKHAINVIVRLARPMLCLCGLVYGPLWRF